MLWGPGGWMWLWGPLMMLFWVAVIAVAVWLIIRAIAAAQRPREEPGGDGRDPAKGILAERYARGEMTTEEYRERLDQPQ
ncbi:MAG: SHOCT domain-containing protein [Streptosporangiales bacterium]|nr:SHOCT domain-containing protein [Streptosporangiales bacterium]